MDRRKRHRVQVSRNGMRTKRDNVNQEVLFFGVISALYMAIWQRTEKDAVCVCVLE